MGTLIVGVYFAAIWFAMYDSTQPLPSPPEHKTKKRKNKNV